MVHGDLQEDDLVISRGRVRGVTGWTDLHVGDPAGDFAWLLAARDARLAEGVLEAYTAACRRTSFQAPDREPDPHLLERARLDAEMALAQWLVRAVDRGAEPLVADAEQMLAVLERDVARRPGGGTGPERTGPADGPGNPGNEHRSTGPRAAPEPGRRPG